MKVFLPPPHVFTLLLITVVVFSGCKLAVNKFAFHPDTENVIEQNALPDGIHEVSITTKDKVKIISLFLPSPESNKVLIYFHGNAGNIYHRIPDLLRLQKTGINVMGVSYRGYGKSEGKPSEKGLYMDGEAVFAHVTEQMGFNAENIIVFGRSIGTTVAVNTAQNKTIKGLILVTPLTSGKDQARAMGLGSFSSVVGKAFDNISKIKNIRAPLIVIHGTDDQVIPFYMGEKIFSEADVKKEFVKIIGANHNNLQSKFGQKYWPPIIRFIK